MLSYSIYGTLTVKTNQRRPPVRVAPGKKKGLKARSRGKWAMTEMLQNASLGISSVFIHTLCTQRLGWIVPVMLMNSCLKWCFINARLQLQFTIINWCPQAFYFRWTEVSPEYATLGQIISISSDQALKLFALEQNQLFSSHRIAELVLKTKIHQMVENNILLMDKIVRIKW